jgi:hypothetical protein
MEVDETNMPSTSRRRQKSKKAGKETSAAKKIKEFQGAYSTSRVGPNNDYNQSKFG